VVKNAVMVLHGYKRPGVGYIIGNCPATRRFQPYEVSKEGTVYMRDLAADALHREAVYLKKLKDGGQKEFNVSREKKLPYSQRRALPESERYDHFVVKKGDGQKRDDYDSKEWYEYALEGAIHNTEATIRQIKHDLVFLTQKITDWKPVDLAAVNAAAAEAEAEEAKGLCPGSGTWDHDRSRMGYAYFKGGKCKHCGYMITASSTGKMRKHTPEGKTPPKAKGE
jgi:hypothetical protein